MIVASISSERRERSVNQFVKTTSLTEVPSTEEQKKYPPAMTGGRGCSIRCAATGSCLLNSVLRQMAIRFGVLLQFGLVVDTGVSQLEGAISTRDVCRNVDNTGDFGQIASDRGGTTTSVHIRHFEAYQRRDVVIIRCCVRHGGNLVFHARCRHRSR